MRIIKCDRCGCEIPKSTMVGYVSVRQKEVVTGALIGENPYEQWDLCDECMNAVKCFIKKTTEKPAAETKKPVKPFDAGGAQALRDRGWSLQRIADEMGVAVSTVAKHTKPGKPKKEFPHEWAESEPDLKR